MGLDSSTLTIRPSTSLRFGICYFVAIKHASFRHEIKMEQHIDLWTLPSVNQAMKIQPIVLV
jgi:hypothetical protein